MEAHNIPFGHSTTAAEILEGIDLSGKRAIVTGGASGIGAETVRALAIAGAEVTIAVRNTETGEKTARALRSKTGNQAILVKKLDLNDWDSIDRFTESWSGKLDILINNAGVMAIQELQRDSRGHEMQFATNHLGHFKLTAQLHGALAKAKHARVVAVASSANLFSPVVFDDIDFNFRAYDPIAAYGQSKTAIILFALEAAKRWASDGIVVNSLNPGAIATNLQRHVGGKLLTPRSEQKTPEQGASTSILLAASPTIGLITGTYFNDNQVAETVTSRPANASELPGKVAMYATDEANAKRLWEVSGSMIRA